MNEVELSGEAQSVCIGLVDAEFVCVFIINSAIALVVVISAVSCVSNLCVVCDVKLMSVQCRLCVSALQ